MNEPTVADLGNVVQFPGMGISPEPLNPAPIRPKGEVDTMEEPHDYFVIPPTALVVKAGERRLDLTVTRSSSELLKALDASAGKPLLLVAERERYVERESLAGLACYLRHCGGLRQFRRKHGPIFPLTRWGWAEFQRFLSIRWRPVPRAELPVAHVAELAASPLLRLPGS